MAYWMSPDDKFIYKIFSEWQRNPKLTYSQIAEKMGVRISPNGFSQSLRALASRASKVPGWANNASKMTNMANVATTGGRLSTGVLARVGAAAARTAAAVVSPTGLAIATIVVIAGIAYWYYTSSQSQPTTQPDIRGGGSFAQNSNNQPATSIANSMASGDLAAPLTSRRSSGRSSTSTSETAPTTITVPDGIGEIEILPRPASSGRTVTLPDGYVQWQESLVEKMGPPVVPGTYAGQFWCVPKAEFIVDGRNVTGFFWFTEDYDDTEIRARKVPINQAVIDFKGGEPAGMTIDLGFARGYFEIESETYKFWTGEIDGVYVVIRNQQRVEQLKHLEEQFPFGDSINVAD